MHKISKELKEELAKAQRPITALDVKRAKVRLANKRWRDKNREKYNAYQKEYKARNKEKLKKARDEHNQRIANSINKELEV